MAGTSSTTNMVTLRSSDGGKFSIYKKAAYKSDTIKSMMEGEFAGAAEIPVNVASDILALIVEYCNKHVDVSDIQVTSTGFSRGKSYTNELQAWDKGFLSSNLTSIPKLLEAASYLGIGGLVFSLTLSISNVVGRGLKDESTRELYEQNPKQMNEDMRQKMREAFGP